jgi:hypothetical protein
VVLTKPETVPKTSAGKIQRVLCRTLYQRGELERAIQGRSSKVVPITVKVPGERLSEAAAAPAPNPASGAGTIDAMMTLITNWSVSRGHGAPSHPGQTFAEIGFDSVSSVELTHFLESELRLDLDQTLLWTYTTFGALARYLAGTVDSRETGAAAGREAPIAEAANW